jgi:predicted O-methyltransferase YrrM
MANFDSYLEIGTFDGIALSLYAETYPGKQFTAIDSFEVGYATGNGHYEYFFENCKNLDNVNLYRARSCDVLPYIKETFGMIFIDGDHSFESILTDYRLTWRLLEKGGMLVFHDIDLDDTLRVLSIVEAEQNVAIHTTDVGVVYVRKP